VRTDVQYRSYRKPSWAPPAWLFAPVWTLLYILIAISFGYVGFLWLRGALPFGVVLPFILNLIFNFLFTPIQFRLRKFTLAALDVILVWLTLGWALWVILPLVPWVAYLNVPYLAWVTFALVLQVTIAAMNKK